MMVSEREESTMENPMSRRQSWAIKCASGLDVRDVEMSYGLASAMIRSLNNADEYDTAVGLLQENGATGTPKGYTPYVKGQKKSKKNSSKGGTRKSTGESAKDRANRELYERADAAGREAANGHEAVPMQVVQRAKVLDDTSPVLRTFEPTMGGVCGFSWTVVKDGRTSFAKWLVKNSKGRQSEYYGGVLVWGEDTKYNGQSMSTKEAYTSAFARVLGEAGIKLQTYSRMD